VVLRLYYIFCALIAGRSGFAPTPADAQDTAGPVKILLGFADEAGYAFAQLISESIGNAMGRPVAIERKPGATGRIAAEALKNADPDGTTLYLAPIVVPVLAPLVFRNLRYDPLKDFAPVTQVLTFDTAGSGPAIRRTAPGSSPGRTHGKPLSGQPVQAAPLLWRDDRPGGQRTWFTCRTRARRRCWPTSWEARLPPASIRSPT
jgi:hypothetical protein